MGELYTDGEWTRAAAGLRREALDADGAPVTTVAEAEAEASTAVDRAVRAARRAVEGDRVSAPTRHRAPEPVVTLLVAAERAAALVTGRPGPGCQEGGR
ncbi:hypothetical protein [Streptomyces sp. NPDC096012]|uniref:hypothetical protein n=1 Tax=Streptomyces sp. NPDC096012 TaxID=3155684 RepID=UPI00336AE678